MTIFVSPSSILEGKFPLPPILFLFLALSFLIYKLVNLEDIPNYRQDDSLINANYFRLLGIIVSSTTVLLEAFIFDGSLSANSLSLIILGFYLVIYPDIKLQSNYKKMLLVFLFLFTLFSPVATVIFRILTDNLELFSDDEWTAYVVHRTLGAPVSNFLSLLGFQVWASGSSIFFIDKTLGLSSSVSIATGCSGIDSVVVFICALFSYIYVEYRIRNPITFLLFFLGIIMSYFANIMRMSVIILAGHYWGADALQFAHATIGWLIFTFWIFIFWRIMDFIIIGNIRDNLKSTR